MYYWNCYFFFSILGFLFESILFLILKRHYNSGILYGPWTPIYGLAFFIILGIHKVLKKWHFHKIVEYILFFLLSTILLSILELIGGELILFLFHVRYWNYEKSFLNIDGFICLEVSLFWGVCSLITNYIIYPRVKDFIRRIPKFVTYFLILFSIIDIVCTLFYK